MIEIDSPKKLENWLKDKPPAWSAAIALRVALRMLPFVCDPLLHKNDFMLARVTAAAFRRDALSWIAGTIPTQNKTTRTKAYLAADAAARAAANIVADSGIYFADYAAVRAAADTAVDATVDTAGYSTRLAAADAAAYSEAAARAAVFAAASPQGAAAVWLAISYDCALLNNVFFPDSFAAERALVLVTERLWPSGAPEWFATAWKIAQRTLSKSSDGFEIWHDWFQRRMDGSATGFDLSSEADTEMGRRLINASNKWWEREPAAINADIKAWLTELTPIFDEPIETYFIQNPRALTFGANSVGQIGLAPDAAANRLVDDADAHDRHTELLREAKSLRTASQHGQTQATDLDQPVREFIEAIGESLATTKPSWLVARGEKLRRLRKQRQDGTSLAPPLSERQAEAIDALVTALDIMVGLDPYLHSIRQAIYDPDLPKGSGDPVAIRLVIDHALKIEVARADAHGALADAVANVPIDAAPDDRRRLTLWADFKNFIQATGRFIWKHKGKVTFAGVAAAIKLIQLNAATLKGIFAASPTMIEIIRWIELIKLPG